MLQNGEKRKEKKNEVEKENREDSSSGLTGKGSIFA